MKSPVVLAIGFVLLLSTVGAAAEKVAIVPSSSGKHRKAAKGRDPDAVLEEAFSGISHKFLRGTVNAFFGWVDIPVRTWERKSLKGFGIGIRDCVVRTATGLADVATFPLAWPKEKYKPLIDPEFPI